jgi:hypothetical protein
MKKIVINKCYGGFGLSNQAIERYGELKGLTLIKEQDKFNDYYYRDETNTAEPDTYFHDRDIERTDPFLVQVVEEMGKDADGGFAELKIVEIPDDVAKWVIDEYDGVEWVAEPHRTWR